MPGLAGEQEQAPAAGERVVEAGDELGQLGARGPRRRLRGGSRRRLDRSRRRRPPGQRRILREYRPLELAQPLARLDPQLLDQCPAGVLVGLQRVRLAVRAVEREHQLRAEPLPVAGARRSAPRAARPPRRGRRARASPRSAAPSARDPQVFQPGDLRAARTARRRDPPAAPRAIAPAPRSSAGRPRRVAADKLAAALGHEPLEALRVEPVRIERQLVAALARDDDAGRAVAGLVRQRLAQTRDRASAPSWPRRRAVAPPRARRSAGRC